MVLRLVRLVNGVDLGHASLYKYPLDIFGTCSVAALSLATVKQLFLGTKSTLKTISLLGLVHILQSHRLSSNFLVDLKRTVTLRTRVTAEGRARPGFLLDTPGKQVEPR